MLEMNPYYAHESEVGPVFDVANWSPGKNVAMAIAALVFGVALLGFVIAATKPTLLLDDPPELVTSLTDEFKDLRKEHPWGTYAGLGVATFLGVIGLMGAVACTVDVATARYYFRAGPGGISFRVPQGFDWSKAGLAFSALEIDLPHDAISNWTITQTKQFGSMSQNAGNISASISIRTFGGKKYGFSLDMFREPAHVIKSKIDDALEMTPAMLGPEPSYDDDSHHEDRWGASVPEVISGHAAYAIVREALEGLLARSGLGSAVVLSDTESGKFVQFATNGTGLLLDLPGQGLDAAEARRAVELFQRCEANSEGSGESGSTPSGLTATSTELQLELGIDAGRAAEIALAVFEDVYRLPAGFSVSVERV